MVTFRSGTEIKFFILIFFQTNSMVSENIQDFKNFKLFLVLQYCYAGVYQLVALLLVQVLVQFQQRLIDYNWNVQSQFFFLILNFDQRDKYSFISKLN